MEKNKQTSADTGSLKQPWNANKVIFVAAISMLFVFVISGILWIISSLTSINLNNIFDDFAETLSFCLIKNPYNGEYGATSIYPPLAFLIFYPFALISKGAVNSYLNGDINIGELTKSPSFLISFLLFYAICLAIVLFLCAKISKFKGKKLAMLLIIVFCFSPLAFCFIRGNNIILALIFVLLFFYLKDSEKKSLREVANLCLAITITLKIYPAILLLIFLKDRRWLDILKTLLYSLILIFVPFLFISGGFKNLKEIWNNCIKFATTKVRKTSLTNISLDALSMKITNLFGLPTTFYSVLSIILRLGLIILTLVVFILAKNSRKKMQISALGLLTYELFAGVSYAYSLVFLIVPIIYYFMDFETFSKSDKVIYGLCFGVIAFPLWFAIYNFSIPQLFLIVLLIKIYVDLILEFKNNRSKTNEKSLHQEQEKN